MTDLQVVRWPVDRLIPFARNARTHSDEQVAQIAASIAEFGWTNPILAGADGIVIRDKGVLKQIVDIAKQGFGGNLDMAIRSPQIRDLVELYALSTGQGTSGLPGTMRPVSLFQQGGSLFQSNPGGLTLDRIGSGTPTSAAPTVINITVPGAKEFFEKETVRVVVENPRAVQSAAMAATKQNAGRREMTGLQLSPGLIVS